MDDHVLFLQHEIAVMEVDDWMNLPRDDDHDDLRAVVFEGLTPAADRHFACFTLTH